MIFTIFRKELNDTLRDRRTLIMMLVIPILIFPIILNVFVSVSHSFQKDAKEKALNIGYVGEIDNGIYEQLMYGSQPDETMNWVLYKDSTTLIKDLKADSIQLGITVPPASKFQLESEDKMNISVLYNATDLGIKDRAESLVERVKTNIVNKRIQLKNLNPTFIEPVESTFVNLASGKEMIGKLAGGILPYIFIAFGFLGCMYPAIDLFTGEKERGTIETLLTTPVKRWQILFGKMGVVVLSGLLAATCALLGLFFSIEVLQLVDNAELLAIIHSVLSFEFIILLYALLIPLTIFFAGVMIPIAVYAKTFKEAQSIITPLNIVMVLPAMVGFFPGIELNAVTAAIPVVNIVLATKEIIADTLNYGHLLIAFGVMITLALLAVVISYKQFDKETNVVLS